MFDGQVRKAVVGVMAIRRMSTLAHHHHDEEAAKFTQHVEQCKVESEREVMEVMWRNHSPAFLFFVNVSLLQDASVVHQHPHSPNLTAADLPAGVAAEREDVTVAEKMAGASLAENTDITNA